MTPQEQASGLVSASLVQIQNGWLLTVQSKVSAATIFFPEYALAVSYLKRLAKTPEVETK